MDFSSRRERPAYNTIKNRNPKYMDFPLFLIVLSLLGLGLVALFSASSIYAADKGHTSLYYVQRQAVWILLGLGAAAVIARIDLEKIRKLIKPAVVLTLILLGATLLMPPVAGARRWIPLGFMKLQMSEFAKIVLVLYLADFFDRRLSHIAADPRQLLKPLGAAGLMLALIGLEPDLGTPTLMFMIALFMLFAAGVKLRFILAPVAAGAAVFVEELFRNPYRITRLKTFLSPWEYKSGAGWQLTQSLLAVGSGGWLGKGLGASQLKLLYLPEPHTDFIFSVIAEETGFLGSMLIVLLFLALLVKGVRIARNAPSFYTSLAALGLTLMLAGQAFFNMAVTMGLIPTKGIPLPFFSYGGSSILTSLIAVGIILNISAHRSQSV